ncbi:hypothetical protein [Agromyces sp. NPDC056965]|uniref:hypothetical protein n=1 Tax=Agromyces sp. NPDC056965 TaxID=3345983 RepID=UPI00362D6A1E
MPKPPSADTTGHVVHLLDRLDAFESVPESLGLPARLGPVGHSLFAAANVVATLGVVAVLMLLWSGATPGWWFDAIFTILLAAIPVTIWALLVGSISGARKERAMQAEWAMLRDGVRAEHGVVLARDIRLSEDGTVSSFDLTVSGAEESVFHAEWRPRSATSRGLLQPQVPGIGAPVRIWRTPVDGDGVEPTSLIVVEVADPSVVAASGRV